MTIGPDIIRKVWLCPSQTFHQVPDALKSRLQTQTCHGCFYNARRQWNVAVLENDLLPLS